MNNIIKSIELDNEFKYPLIYKELLKDGMLDYKTEIANENQRLWYKSEYPKLAARPPLLFFGTLDFKIMSFGRIISELKEIPEYWNPEFKLIPFGMTGGGDWYAFSYNHEENGNIPIVIVYHDAEYMKVLSKNMEDFIFRGLLECGKNIEDNEEDIYREQLLLMLESHKKYISDKRYTLLKKIFNRPIEQFEEDFGRYIEKNKGFVGSEEIAEILESEINFNLLNKSITYQLY